jgi:hypothetical protein
MVELIPILRTCGEPAPADDEESTMNEHLQQHGRRRRVAPAGVRRGGAARMRRPRTLAALAAAALVGGGWAAVVGANAAAVSAAGTPPYAMPTQAPAPGSVDQAAVARIRAHIAELRGLETQAIQQRDFSQVQALEVQLNGLKRQLADAAVEPAAARTGSAAGPAAITPPVSSDGVFSDGRDTAFELGLTA